MSLRPRGRASAPPLVTTVRGLIERLARRDAVGEIQVADDGTRSLGVMTLTNPAGVTAAAIWPVFQHAAEHGLIAALDDTGLRWILSRAGRTALRKLKSEGGGEIPQAVAAARPDGAPLARVDAAESPLSWLRRRRDKSGEPMITAVQFDAGERIRSDFLFAGMTPRVTVNWLATGGSSGKGGGGIGVELRDNVIAAQQRVRRALAAVSPMSASLLIDVCGHLKGLEEIERARGWPPRSGKIALQMALTELARHYRLPGSDAGADLVARRLHHWGVADYRPGVEPMGQE